MVSQPIVRCLEISNFRGIKRLKWTPSDHINVLIGGGDTGKSTVLYAISLLFSPTNNVPVLETDFFCRQSEAGFTIEAIVALPDEVGTANHSQMLWPWVWNGADAVVPDPDNSSSESPVYKLRVRGTEDLEAVWEVVQPNGDVVGLSAGLRRRIGIVRLTNDDRNDRDLRLVAGSALDRLVSEPSLKARINQVIAGLNLSEAFMEKEAKALEQLDGILQRAGLPHGLDLGLTSSQGLSIGALIGLLADKNGINLPLANWGAGTRRMAALEISSATEASIRLTVVDEIERGLEPHRLRQVMSKLETGGGQSFVTTHSPITISCSDAVALWYMDSTGKIGPLAGPEIASQQRRAPETFLSTLAVIAEGVTEVGFLRFILRQAFDSHPAWLGIRICDAGGNEAMLGLLEALQAGGLRFAGFCDNEGRFPERWDRLKATHGLLLFQWQTGCVEENVIAHVPDNKLLALATDPDGEAGPRLRTLADRLGIQNKDPQSILDACEVKGDIHAVLRQAIVAAATGSKVGAPADKAKEWAKHSQVWFKSEAGGRELATKARDLGAWQRLEPDVLPFINALRGCFHLVPFQPGELPL